MIGLDTNLLVRLCVRDDPEQVASVLKLLSKAPPASVRVSVIVLAELVWTLLRRYRIDKVALIETVEELVSRAELDVEAKDTVMTALDWYRDGKADFADYLIAALNYEAGAMPTYTFDQDAASNPVVALVL